MLKLLADEGIAPDEALVVQPGTEGSTIQMGADMEGNLDLYECGFTMHEIISSQQIRPDIAQLGLISL